MRWNTSAIFAVRLVLTEVYYRGNILNADLNLYDDYWVMNSVPAQVPGMYCSVNVLNERICTVKDSGVVHGEYMANTSVFHSSANQLHGSLYSSGRYKTRVWPSGWSRNVPTVRRETCKRLVPPR